MTLRTGVVLSGAGGALKKQLPPFRLGLGARLGRGYQQLSWITRRDVVAAISFLLQRDTLSGPFNLTAPHPVSNASSPRNWGEPCTGPRGSSCPRRHEAGSGRRNGRGVPPGFPTGGA